MSELFFAEVVELAKSRGFNVKTVGADKGYHTKAFVQECRDRTIAPHVARVKGRRTPGLDGRTTRSAAYWVSQRLRKKIEEHFGRAKAFGNFRKSRWIGGGEDALCWQRVQPDKYGEAGSNGIATTAATCDGMKPRRPCHAQMPRKRGKMAAKTR